MEPKARHTPRRISRSSPMSRNTGNKLELGKRQDIRDVLANKSAASRTGTSECGKAMEPGQVDCRTRLPSNHRLVKVASHKIELAETRPASSSDGRRTPREKMLRSVQTGPSSREQTPHISAGHSEDSNRHEGTQNRSGKLHYGPLLRGSVSRGGIEVTLQGLSFRAGYRAPPVGPVRPTTVSPIKVPNSLPENKRWEATPSSRCFHSEDGAPELSVAEAPSRTASSDERKMKSSSSNVCGSSPNLLMLSSLMYDQLSQDWPELDGSFNLVRQCSRDTLRGIECISKLSAKFLATTVDLPGTVKEMATLINELEEESERLADLIEDQKRVQEKSQEEAARQIKVMKETEILLDDELDGLKRMVQEERVKLGVISRLRSAVNET